MNKKLFLFLSIIFTATVFGMQREHDPRTEGFATKTALKEVGKGCVLLGFSYMLYLPFYAISHDNKFSRKHGRLPNVLSKEKKGFWIRYAVSAGVSAVGATIYTLADRYLE